MTVGDLIKELMELPEAAIVVLARDAEGNGFSPLEQAGRGDYEPRNAWSGEVVEGRTGSSVTCVVLWPMN